MEHSDTASGAMRLLVVEHDKLLGDALATSLRQAGFEVDCESTGPGADTALTIKTYGLVILEVGLPDIDGFEVLRRLRQRGQLLPVVLISARDAIEDRVHGLDLGADDYILKPFDLRELEARVRAQLRRILSSQAQKLSFGPLELDVGGHRAQLSGRPLELTAKEWRTLELLVRRAEKVVTKAQLQNANGWRDKSSSPNAVEARVSRLRSKLVASNVYIETVRGLGYVLNQPIERRD
jgi:DNA-binding response OmpR family regulator